MSEPTVEEVLKLSDEKLKEEKNKSSALGAVIALFLFPPLGVFLVWREKKFHKIYAVYSIIIGALNLLTAFSVYTSVYPALLDIYKQMGISANQTGIAFQTLALIIFSLFQIAVSYLLFKKTKDQGFLENKWLIFLTVLLVISFIALQVLFGYLITGFFLNTYRQNELNLQGY